jgi:ribonuclease HI
MDCNRSWRSLVIATDSEYVAVNATERIQLWEMDGWMLASQQGRDRAAVKNQDLWKLFLKLVRQLQGAGVNVALWRIPRNCNERADNFAKLAAEKEGPSYFQIVEYASSTSYRLEPYQNNAGL